MERINLLATYSLHIIYNQVHERNKFYNVTILIFGGVASFF